MDAKVLSRKIKTLRLVLALLACASIVTHLGHADAKHARLTDNDCTICHALTSSDISHDVGLGPRMVSWETAFFDVPFVSFSASLSLTFPRAPPTV